MIMHKRLAALLVIVAIVMAAAGGFVGRDALEGNASAKGPWISAVTDTPTCRISSGKQTCAGTSVTGDPDGDQGIFANLIARLDRDSCEWQPPIPVQSTVVVLYRC
jgi:hypothetical protein